MKSFKFSNNKIRNTWVIVLLLLIVTIGIIIGCGKLKDDERPSSPVGTSGGDGIPVAAPSSLGTFSLSTWAHPPSIPADGVTASTVKAQLEDTSGGSLENFIISFNTNPSSDAACRFLVQPVEPGGSVSYSTSTTGRTGENGKVSVFVYGIRAGSCVIQASLDVDEDTFEDLFDTTNVTVTGGSGVPGTEVAGVELTVDDPYKRINLGTCGETEPGSETFTLTATVWDPNGEPVGAGVRVELSGDISGSTVYWGETDANGQATWTYTYAVGSVGTYPITITATTVIEGESYSDTITFYLVAECDVPTPTPTPTITPTPTPATVTLALSNAPADPPAGGSAAITIIATIDGSPAPAGIDIQLSTTFGTFASSGTNVATVTTLAGGIATETLNSPGAGTATVISSVIEPGYSGAGTPLSIDF